MRQAQDEEKSLGTRLRRLRKARGYSLRELAKAVGTSHRMIAYYEIQGGNPPADVVVKLARALGISADELLGLHAPKKPRGQQAVENVRLMRRLRQIEELPTKDRRNVLQYIDAMVEREELKKAQS